MDVRPPVELVFLGTGNAFAPGRYWSSFLVNGRYLFDCSPAVLAQLRHIGSRPQDIEVIFISHFHGDHYFGLPFLLLDYAERSHRSSDLVIVGPPGIESVTEELYERAYPGLSTKPTGYARRYVEAAEGGQLRAGPLSFEAYRVNHAQGKLECFGYKVWFGNRVIAFTGDTALCEAIFALADGTEVLVIDCTYPAGHFPQHLSFDEIIEVRRRLPLSTTILLTHMEAEQTNRGLEGVIATQDFARYIFL